MRVLTVSATYGAGGSVIAPRLAERLGLPFADRFITAQDAPALGGGLDEFGRLTEGEGSAEEEPRKSFLARLAHLNAGLNLPLPRDPADLRDHIRNRVEHSITELLESGGAGDPGGSVILGRAAAIVLAKHPSAYHVRLDGPVERRARRGAAIEGIDVAAARARLEQTDSARQRSATRLYQRDLDDVGLYHLVLDSTVLDVDDCVAIVAQAANTFWSGWSSGSGGFP